MDAVAAEVADMLRKKGAGGQPGQSAGTLLALLASAQASLADEGQQQAPAVGGSRSASAAGAAPLSGPETNAGAQEGGGGSAQQSQHGAKPGRSMAAAALVQASLNALAAAAPGTEPMSSPPAVLTPTTAAAAALALQVGLLRICMRLGCPECMLGKARQAWDAQRKMINFAQRYPPCHTRQR